MKDVIKILGEVQKVKYTEEYVPVSVARELQEKYRQEGNSQLELLFGIRALSASALCKVPGPWDNGKFDFTPLTLKEMFQSFQGL